LKLSHAGREVTIDARHCSIFLPEFSVPWIKQFTMVVNALDNVKARNHVNRLCLGADIPLVESGTSGYLGESMIVWKGHTSCYECIDKPRQKTFPGCTIRNTPSEPIHCIVWAKFLFGQLFGEPDDEQQVSPDSADPELANGQESDKKGNIARVNTTEWAEKNDWDPVLLFDKFFNEDIGQLLKMSKLWEKDGRKKPTPLVYKDIAGKGDALNTGSIMELRTMKENINAWHSAINQIKERRKSSGILEWDKDDEDSMMFVSSAANVRASIFQLEQKSQWTVKAMAGNIIPAIATTNAVCAGLVTLQAVKILKGRIEDCKEISIRRNAASKKLLVCCRPNDRNPNCHVCAEKPEVTLRCNTKTFTLREFKEKVCQSKLSMHEPDCEAGADIILSSEEGDTTDEMLEKTLEHFKVIHGSELVAEDFQQGVRVTIHVEHTEKLPDGHNDIGFQILGQQQMTALAAKMEEEANVASQEENRKRKIEQVNLDDDEQPVKKQKIQNQDADDDIVEGVYTAIDN
jgi:ubiquitin-like 1-activating enzyme E1 B